MKTKSGFTVVALVVGLLIGAAALVAFAFLRPNEAVSPTRNTASTADESAINPPETMAMALMEREDTLVAQLEDVTGGTGSGTGYVLRFGGILSHSVVANLADPQGNTFYEGWLVQQNPLSFFSTGEMTKNENGEWVLEYESEDTMPNHNFVVITLETVRDNTPETHIIEGLAI